MRLCEVFDSCDYEGYCTGMWRHGVWYLSTDVSEELFEFILLGQSFGNIYVAEDD